jgi:hypothetical protein
MTKVERFIFGLALAAVLMGIPLAMAGCKQPSDPGTTQKPDRDHDGIPDATDPYPDDTNNNPADHDTDGDGVPDDKDLWKNDPAHPADADDWDEDGVPNGIDEDPLDETKGIPPPANIGSFNFNPVIMDINFDNERFTVAGGSTNNPIKSIQTWASLVTDPPNPDQEFMEHQIAGKWYRWLCALQSEGNNILLGYNQVSGVYSTYGKPFTAADPIKTALDDISFYIGNTQDAESLIATSGDNIASYISAALSTFATEPTIPSYLDAYKKGSYYGQLKDNDIDTAKRDAARGDLDIALVAITDDLLPTLNSNGDNIDTVLAYLKEKLSTLIDSAMDVGSLDLEADAGADGKNNRERVTQLNECLIEYIGDLEEYRACVNDIKAKGYDTPIYDLRYLMPPQAKISILQNSNDLDYLKMDHPNGPILTSSAQSTDQQPRLASIKANRRTVVPGASMA